MEAQEYDAARDWANKALAAVEQLKPRNQHGESVHDGNAVLGRLALREGDVEGAKSYLMAASKTIGSPTLNTFGPNLLLAEELSKAGHKETVVKYLEACQRFWVSREAQLIDWIRILKEGDTPDFANNLRI